MKKIIVAGALGECVHVAGILNFLRLAETAGWHTIFLGPAVPVDQFAAALREHKPQLAGVSYRLTPENGERLLARFSEEIDDLREAGMRFAFGGTPPVAQKAAAMGFFEKVFNGSETDEESLAYLQGLSAPHLKEGSIPQTLVDRIHWKQPKPILRHHFGLPSLEATRQGIKTIAQAGVLDVISLGIDQDAQENFFHPERQNPGKAGAGGAPVRTAEQYKALFAASRTGNFPLMRTYSGSDDFIALAQMYQETIHNAWCAVPLFWFNKMDGRGPWDLKGSIAEHQKLMRWHGERAIPVELNEPHHWGLRYAPDVLFVVAAYLGACNARAAGVKDYIAQFMFNCPPNTSESMDLAKMLAALDMIEPLAGNNFTIWRQTRTGLLSYPLDPAAARAHLASSVHFQLQLQPHLIHVVSHVEADHAATANDVVEACIMADHVITRTLGGRPTVASDPVIRSRRRKLVHEANITLKAILSLAGNGVKDAFTDPGTLAEAVRVGILDAPHLRNNPFAPGLIRTAIIDGACEAVDEDIHPLSETERTGRILKEKK